MIIDQGAWTWNLISTTWRDKTYLFTRLGVAEQNLHYFQFQFDIIF